MSSKWKMGQETHSPQSVIVDIWKSFCGVPLLAWVFLLLGLLGLLWAQSHPMAETATPPHSGASHSVVLNPLFYIGDALKNLPWWGLLREVSTAAVISFFLTLFLEEPLRAQTITKVGRDIAPFLIAALTVPEMRFKMRQICESGVIRKESKLLLWIEEPSSKDAPNRYTLKVQVRSKFCNISNAAQKIRARIAVDEETNGKILGLYLRPVELQDVSDIHWSAATEPPPPPIDGRRMIEKETHFPKCDDWDRSYIEVTSEYQEDVTLIGGVGRTLIESLWPLIGIEIECVSRPKNIELRLSIPFSKELKRINDSDRWLSSVALLPGERVDIVVVKKDKPSLPTETLLITQNIAPTKATETEKKTDEVSEKSGNMQDGPSTQAGSIGHVS